MLEKVKTALGITGNFQDATIQSWIDEVKQFLLDGGVSESVVNSDTSAGIIARGVADLWNYGAGDGKLSPYFIQRAAQLSYKIKADPTSYYTKDEIDEMLAPINEDLETLKSNVSEMDEDIENLKTDSSEMSEDIETLKTDVSEIKEDVSEIKEDVSTIETMVDDVNGEVV